MLLHLFRDLLNQGLYCNVKSYLVPKPSRDFLDYMDRLHPVCMHEPYTNRSLVPVPERHIWVMKPLRLHCIPWQSWLKIVHIHTEQGYHYAVVLTVTGSLWWACCCSDGKWDALLGNRSVLLKNDSEFVSSSWNEIVNNFNHFLTSDDIFSEISIMFNNIRMVFRELCVLSCMYTKMIHS